MCAGTAVNPQFTRSWRKSDTKRLSAGRFVREMGCWRLVPGHASTLPHGWQAGPTQLPYKRSLKSASPRRTPSLHHDSRVYLSHAYPWAKPSRPPQLLSPTCFTSSCTPLQHKTRWQPPQLT
jgi:hypothetical protein